MIESIPQKTLAYDLLVTTPGLTHILRTIDRVAVSDAPVLIIGESGTGKEVVASAIHERSGRNQMPFVCLNLAAVPTELAETVLFGHQKGAFTGASHSSPGFCRKADGGTMFLDEIGEADLLLQAKLLRFLQSREIQPVGSGATFTVDVRFVAATNRDLMDAVRERRFREDLFYRLNVVQITVPPLRERPEDVDCLTKFFLAEFNAKYGRKCRISEGLLDAFRQGTWPGNIRQLRSTIENLVLLSEHDSIGIHDLSSECLKQIGTRSPNSELPAFASPTAELERLTHHLVESIVEQSKGNVALAARRLGISKATLYRWLRKFRTRTS
jgi:transcriptional regulator with PAS, ATPase and Fis domain